RIFDCYQKREVDIARELRSRNRNRNAGRRAEELARELDDDEEWAKSYRSLHLGDKLIALAVRFAKFDGQPIFEFQTVRESDTQGTKTTQRIALTTAASDWIADHDTTLASLSPVYLPMIVPPRSWTVSGKPGASTSQPWDFLRWVHEKSHSQFNDRKKTNGWRAS